MKRIKHACLEQTIHFELKDDVTQAEAVAMVKKELETYKQSLDRRHTRYKVRDEKTMPDGSIMLKIGKQYNSYDCGDYLE